MAKLWGENANWINDKSISMLQRNVSSSYFANFHKCRMKILQTSNANNTVIVKYIVVISDDVVRCKPSLCMYILYMLIILYQLLFLYYTLCCLKKYILYPSIISSHTQTAY